MECEPVRLKSGLSWFSVEVQVFCSEIPNPPENRWSGGGMGIGERTAGGGRGAKGIEWHRQKERFHRPRKTHLSGKFAPYSNWFYKSTWTLIYLQMNNSAFIQKIIIPILDKWVRLFYLHPKLGDKSQITSEALCGSALWFSTGGSFVPSRYSPVTRDIFWSLKLGGCYWDLEDRDQGSCYTSDSKGQHLW